MMHFIAQHNLFHAVRTCNLLLAAVGQVVLQISLLKLFTTFQWTRKWFDDTFFQMICNSDWRPLPLAFIINVIWTVHFQFVNKPCTLFVNKCFKFFSAVGALFVPFLINTSTAVALTTASSLNRIIQHVQANITI